MAAVEGFEPAIFNTPDGSRPPGFPKPPGNPNPTSNAETTIYTPVNVVIERTISGPWATGPNQFLIEGGTVGCYSVRVDVAPRVEPGSRYVFIVSEALDDGGKNPLPLYQARFAWPFGHQGKVVTVDGLMTVDALAEVVQEATPSSGPSGSE